jgi:5-methylcytosine-specific restriction endonuclease McrA
MSGIHAVLKDLTGQRFGMRVVLRRAPDHLNPNGRSETRWETLCDCGTVSIASPRNLRITVSCGCYKKQPLVFCALTISNEDKVKQRARFNHYRQGAKTRKLPFDLTFESFISLTGQDCYYCGMPPYNGIDRINNEAGYTLTNCVPCCWDCNRAKGTVSHAEFIKWVKRVHDRVLCKVA